MKRYPLQALLDAAGMTLSALRDVCPMSGQTYRNARTLGLTADQADRWAVKVRLHPFDVWPEMADHAIEDARRAEEERLERRRQIARESARRRYHEDAELRERRKAAAAAWRADNVRTLQHHPSRQPEARREQSRRFYERHADRLKAEQRDRYQLPEVRAAKNAADRAAHARRRAMRTDEENAA